MAIDPDFWLGRRVLVTGHTGFKGAWLSLWLQSLGADLAGLAPGVPTRPSLYQLADVGAHMRTHDVDVRDREGVLAAVAAERPQVLLHLAAQPMVRRGLAEPALTYEVNVLGTVNVLDAVRRVGGVEAVVVVTSDKCYENAGDGRRFVEGDPLGGADPYSSSKACAELVAASFRASYFHGGSAPRLATARAGNVIGGGDWGEDRLLADAVRAVEDGQPLRVRNPNAVRPWQHVLNPLSGYLRVAEELAREGAGGGGAAGDGAARRGETAARAWNFGPRPADTRPVGWVVERLARLWDGELRWETDDGPQPPEATLLSLDSTAAERALGWAPAWGLERGLELVVAWHRRQRRGEDMRAFSLAQVKGFERSPAA